MTPARYSLAAIALHWLIAIALAFQISLGWTLEGPNTLELFARFQLHKSIGITILALSLIRLAIRFTVPRPPPSDGPAWARGLAGLVHGAFYAVMIGGPITGWLLVSTARIKVPTLIFGTIPLPHLPVGHGWHEPAEQIHALLAWLALLLFALHVAGAFRHQWLLGKPELQRMIPFARGRAIPAAIGALLLIAAALFAAKTISPDRPRIAHAAAPRSAPEAAVPAAPQPAAQPPQAAEPVPARPWTVQPGGRLGFTASWNGDAVRGSFRRWRAAIRFSPDALDTSTIRVTVDLASADTGDAQRDDSLKGDDSFDIAGHGTATFTSRAIRQLGGDRYEAAGTLDLKGISRPTLLRFTLKIGGDRARASGTSQVDRTRHHVGTGEWASTDAIAAAVAIDFAFTAIRR